ncbi:MAG: STAS domain-containing protein [Solirubrobacteraceae bacterium]
MHEQTGASVTTVLDDVAILTITGELDFALCVKLTPEFNAALRSPARAIVIDLEGVSLVDSSGIALLLNAYRSLDHSGRELAIACPSGPQRRAFELTALDRQLPMHETRKAALAAVGAT